MVTATRSDAVIGGGPVAIATYPFMVALIDHQSPAGREGDHQFCGGTLIAPQWVLTAANCVYLDLRQQAANEIDVYVGSADLTKGDRIAAAELIVHPQYNRGSGENDIALIRLQRPPRAETRALPVKFATDPALENDPKTRPVTAIGWGATQAGSRKPSHELRAVDLRLQWYVMACPLDSMIVGARWSPVTDTLDSLRISRDAQDQLFKRAFASPPSLIPPHALCTAGASSLSTLLHGEQSFAPADPGPCVSDAGGPLIGTDPDGSAVQLGIVSFPYGYERMTCDHHTMPPYYISVGAYADWIKAAMAKQ